MRRDPNFYKNYNVVIKKVGNSSDYNSKNEETKDDDSSYKTATKIVKAAQWSYKVNPGDSN